MKNSLFVLSVLLQTSLFYSQAFLKITAGPLASTNGDSRSVNWVDVNNDGLIDCQITNGPTGGQNNRLYLNAGAGNFTAVSGDPIVMDNKPSDGSTWADTDNDGDLDCFTANWYNVNNLFYINNGSGNFSQETTGSLVNDAGYSETAAWGDYDNDGLVDLYVTNSAGAKRNFLYQNLGANTFSKVTMGSQVTDAFDSRSVNWTDIDMDGDLDIFVTNESNGNENIYRNDGSGNFTALSAGPLLHNAGHTMSGSWGDFDNDGDLDVFLANDQSPNALFRNDGNFTFTKLVSDTVSKTPGNSFSSSWSDVDNDGDLDLFVTNAFKTGTKLVNYFYLNNGNSSFTRTNNALTADSAWSYGCAFGDYDNDGFEDLAVATCRYAGVDIPDLLYHNNGNANKWLTLKLVGTSSNRSAIGAKIKLKAQIAGKPVWQLREVSAQSAYCSQNDLRVHFGLGDAAIIDSVKIEWPSGIVDHSLALSPNQFLTFTESINTTSVKKTNKKFSGLEIFPNPSGGAINLVPGRPFNIGDKILVSDVSGKQVVEIVLGEPAKQYAIDLKKYDLSSGNYLITLISGDEKIMRSILLH